jgi:16S rRNA (guanine527-N7)-methyltransferase
LKYALRPVFPDADVSALQPTLDRLGIALSAEAVVLLERYRDLLLEANRLVNLTAISDPHEVDVRLIGESLALLPLIPSDALTLLDVGSGGGIPGVPIAIARPEIRVTLLDATEKKARFLTESARALELTNVVARWGRAEELAHDPAQRASYGVVTARGVARLTTLTEYTLPFAQVGGVVILPKGSGAAVELGEAGHAIELLGGRARPSISTPRQGSFVVVIDKTQSTPSNYPRRTGVPAKSPLIARFRPE